jgi:membrane-bound serine protease (ClpP class)
MNFLLDPNISYLILVAGFVLAVLALFAPGTGLLEVGAVLAIVFAGYSVAKLPINWWALVILLVGVFPILIALKRSRNLIFLVISILALVVGSVFMFRLDSGFPAVDPFLAAIVSILVAGLMWIIATRGMDALLLKPYSRTGKMINQVGTARSDVYHTGTVFVQNEEWSARSQSPIPAGTKVKVIRKDGFTLEVEPWSADQDQTDLLHE